MSGSGSCIFLSFDKISSEKSIIQLIQLNFPLVRIEKSYYSGFQTVEAQSPLQGTYPKEGSNETYDASVYIALLCKRLFFGRMPQ